MKYKCLIVDDEKPARDLIETYVGKIQELELVAVCENVLTAKSILNENDIDILFLDIQMPELSGIEFLRLLKKTPATILITAHSNYALESYELDVVDYLLKPVEFSRFYKAVNKAMDSLGKDVSDHDPKHAAATVQSFPGEESKFIFVKADKEIIKLHTGEILFIESEREYVQIYARKQKVLTLQALSKFSEILPENQFFRVHRSYIVNIEAIESIMGNTIYIGEHRIPISRGQRQEFLDRINKDKLF